MNAVSTTDFSAMDLPSLASAIFSENGRAIRTAKTAVDHAIRCGEMLLAAKAKVPHGEWESWVTSETEVSLRTASRYMQAAKSANVADLEPDLAIAEVLEMVTPSTPASQDPVKPPKASKPSAVVVVDAEIVEPLTEKQAERLAQCEAIIEKALPDMKRETEALNHNPWEASRQAIAELEKISDKDRSPLADVLLYIEKRWNINFVRKEGKP